MDGAGLGIYQASADNNRLIGSLLLFKESFCMLAADRVFGAAWPAAVSCHTTRAAQSPRASRSPFISPPPRHARRRRAALAAAAPRRAHTTGLSAFSGAAATALLAAVEAERRKDAGGRGVAGEKVSQLDTTELELKTGPGLR